MSAPGIAGRTQYYGEFPIFTFFCEVVYCSYEKFRTFGFMRTKQQHKSTSEPTKAELEILNVLWEHGSASVRFVNDRLNESREVNYTTTLKLMQIMVEKSILTRDESSMKHTYSVAEAEQETKAHLLDKFVETLYKGSASKLVMQLLGNKRTSSKDLEEIRKMLDKMDPKQ